MRNHPGAKRRRGFRCKAGMTRIEDRFAQLRQEGRKAFIAYITAGDPNLATTLQTVLALARAGVDIIELGVPFSDPIADGPVIQRATERALSSGTRLADVLMLAGDIRKESQVPLVLFSYYNLLLNHGLDRLARDARDSGFDGVLASDLPIEESKDYCSVIQGQGLNTIFLVAPTSSEERVARIAKASTGFLYAVSRTGVTGERSELDPELRQFLAKLRRHATVPIAVGFGISRPEHVSAVWEVADGAIVGSAIVNEMEKHLNDAHVADHIERYVRALRGGSQ